MSETGKQPLDHEKVVEMEDRIRQRHRLLEQEARQLKARVRVLGLGLLAALALNLLTVLSPQLLGLPGRLYGSGEFRVRHLVLEDSNGGDRGEWWVDEEGNSRLTLLDRQGEARLSLAVLSGGSPGMSLIDAAGQRRAALGLLPDETTNLVFADARGIQRAVLGLNRTDATHLVFADGNGSVQVALGLDESGAGIMMTPEEVVEEPGSEVGGNQD